MTPLFRRVTGAGPLNILALLAGLAFAGYLVWTVLPAPDSLRILIWAAGAAVVHDLIVWPLYALADRAARALQSRDARRLPTVPWINHVRVPVVLSAMMLIIAWPLVIRHSEASYHFASGLTEHPFLGRWLLLSGSAFAGSAVVYAARMVRAARRRP